MSQRVRVPAPSHVPARRSGWRRILPAALATLLAVAAGTRSGAGEEKPFEGFLPFPAGASYHCTQGNRQGPTHNDAANFYAYDFAMPHGAPICAIADGTVTRVKQDTDGPTGRAKDNNVIGIVHGNGTASTYEHIQKDSARVKVGDRVVAGDVICLSGDTGYAITPHLHFTCRNGSYGGDSSPSRFRDVPGDGVPTTNARVASRNFEVRRTAWWRTGQQAAAQFVVCEALDMDGLALAAVDTARKLLAAEQHPSATTILADLKPLEWPRTMKLGNAKKSLAKAREHRDLDELAALAAFGPQDFADSPDFAKECAALAAEFTPDLGWKEADEGLAAARAHRALVAAAIAAEDAALRLVLVGPEAKPDPKGKGKPPKPAPKPAPKPKTPPPAKGGAKGTDEAAAAPPPPADPVLIPGVPDYAAAIAAWERVRAEGVSERAAKAIDARIADLRSAR